MTISHIRDIHMVKSYIVQGGGTLPGPYPHFVDLLLLQIFSATGLIYIRIEVQLLSLELAKLAASPSLLTPLLSNLGP